MAIEKIRHSLAHILAAAVQELYPGTRFGIGPAIENGFYYDFDLSSVASGEGGFSSEDLPKIEKKMRDLLKKDIKFKKKIVFKAEARKLFKNQPYKLELIEEMKDKNVSIYESGKFVDLCKGPHVKSTKEISPDAFKLTRIAGAYWRGSESNPMLTRIYGVAFKTKKELENFLKKEKEAEKREHRKLNEVLDLYQISEEIGPGLVIWKPKGAVVRNIIEDFWRKEHQKRGYLYVFSPHIGKIGLWEKSGHTKFYKENMFPPIEIDKIKYQLKPMNCPFHVQVYQSKIRSYKDLPLRLCELGTVYRYEKTGVLHGLFRVRGFTQDDAHIFCRPDQIHQEIIGVIDLALFMLKSFGFKDIEIDLSLRDPKEKAKYLGNDKIWKKAENALAYALKEKGLKYKEVVGEAVFYGPKIDLKLKDSLGRFWQGPTIQIDFNFPEKFNLNYIDDKGRKRRVVMIHRTVLGAMERFLANLLEHYAGAFPLWLSPEQVWVIPVGSGHKKYAKTVRELSSDSNLRVRVKDAAETVSKKIREGEIQKIPYLLVVGDKEMKTKSVRVRQRGKGDIGPVKLKKFIEKVEKENKNKI